MFAGCVVKFAQTHESLEEDGRALCMKEAIIIFWQTAPAESRSGAHAETGGGKKKKPFHLVINA